MLHERFEVLPRSVVCDDLSVLSSFEVRWQWALLLMLQIADDRYSAMHARAYRQLLTLEASGRRAQLRGSTSKMPDSCATKRAFS